LVGGNGLRRLLAGLIELADLQIATLSGGRARNFGSGRSALDLQWW
jgi:hypothetical protein